MAHNNDTRSQSQSRVDPAQHQLEENIVSSINSLQDEITNLKDIKKLQEDSERLRTRCSNLEKKLVSLETLANVLEQYGRRNNLVLSSIPDTIADHELESTVISVLGNIDVEVESSDIDDCLRIGKPDKANSKKTIIRFANRKYCKKVLNRKKLDNCIRFNPNTKIFVNENLTMMNENIAYNCRKLKWGGLIFACSTRDSIVHMKKSFLGKSFKIHHTYIRHEIFPEFNFNDTNHDEGGSPSIINST